MIEQAIFISKVCHLKYVIDRFSRLYFGGEFCERLFPSLEDIEEILKFIRKRRMKFTFVTPYVTNNGMKKWFSLVEFISQKHRDFEIVINDWGFLRRLQRKDPALPIVLGRLLNKQKKDPRISRLIDKFPLPVKRYFRMCNMDVPMVTKFLVENNIMRVELDNIFHGIMRNNTEVNASLYMPFSYITTGRLCTVSFDKEKSKGLRVITDCNRECRDYTFKLQHGQMFEDLFLKGNTLFLKNDRLPDNFNDLNINRIVYQPEIPL